MIDTVVLRCPEFKVLDSHKLSIQPGVIFPDGSKGESPLFRNGKGITWGSNAFHNDEKKKIYVDIFPNKQEKNPRQGYLSWHLSIPKYQGRDNFLLSTKAEFKDSFSKMEKDLKEIGILADMDSCHIGRLDITKNKKLDMPVMYYKEPLSLIGIKRGKPSNKDTYEDTLYLENSQHSYVLYDKRKEQLFREKKTTLNASDNWGRLEYRVLNKEKMLSTFGTANYREIANNWGILEETYNKRMKNDLFRYSVDDYINLDIVKENEKEKDDIYHLIKIARTNTHQWIGYLEKMIFSLKLHDTYGVDSFLNQYVRILEEEGLTPGSIKAKKSKLKKDLTERILKAKMVESAYKSNNLASLYTEIKSKFIA